MKNYCYYLMLMSCFCSPFSLFGNHEKEISTKYNFEFSKELEEGTEAELILDSFTDSMALVAFYNAADGANWTNSWDLMQPMSTWSGVKVNEEGRVTYLLQGGSELVGFLPPELGNLSSLDTLVISAFNLSGSLPIELGNLTKMKLLILTGSYNGSIPPSIGNLSALQYLVLAGNELTGAIPPELGALSELEYLDLGSNNLTGPIPVELGNLTNLKQGYFNDNELTGGIPTEFGNLIELEVLVFYDNMLTGPVPGELANLTNLYTLELGFNNLSGCYDPNLYDLCALNYISFSNNQNLPWGGDFAAYCATDGTDLCGPNPCVFADSLVLIDLYNSTDGANWNITWDLSQPMSSWNGISVNEDGCVSDIDLFNKNLVNSIPSSLGNLSDLKTLSLTENGLIGTIPSELGNLSNLENLILSKNGLTGIIPIELGNLSNLKRLELYRNELTGAIPTELGDLSNLESLNLSVNELTGAIPSELGNLSNLEALGLYVNELTGAIPSALGNLSNLEVLDLDDNELTGAIPAELGNLIELKILFLRNNELTGTIPPELSNLPEINEIILSDNMLTGVIPAELGNLTYLSDFHVENNQLSGCYDPNLYNLCAVDVQLFNNPGLPWGGDFAAYCATDGTDLCGPNPCVFADSLVLIDLYNSTDGANWNVTWDLSQPMSSWNGISVNEDGCVSDIDLLNQNLVNSIPSSLGNLSDLKTLSLTENELTGIIPIELSNLSNLKTLSLAENELTGTIPLELGNLSNLENLILSRNELTGIIPIELGNLSNLKRLELYSNELTGAIPFELGNLSNLTSLDFERNKLTGAIPSTLGNLLNLDVLILNYNQLTGPIPPELGNLAELRILFLRSNELTGTIPPELSNLLELIEIILSDNMLTGAIPAEIGNMTYLSDLDIENNQLSGCYDPNLFNLCPLDVKFFNNPGLPWGGDFAAYCATNGTDPCGPIDYDCNNITFDVTGNTLMVENLDAPVVQIQIFDVDAGWTTLSNCFDNCDVPTAVFNNLASGTYYVKVRFYDEDWQLICEEVNYVTIEIQVSCANNGGDADGDGICEDADCDDNDANLPAVIGSACDDGDPNTDNDLIQADGCSCAGISQGNDCSDVIITTDNNSITVSGLNAPITQVQIFDTQNGWAQVLNCSGNCNETEVVGGLEEGAYVIKVRFYTANWQLVCALEDSYEVGGENSPCQIGEDEDGDGVCSDVDCDDNDSMVPTVAGTVCDDGDATTDNDVIQTDGCSCAGVPQISPCSDIIITTDNNSITVFGLTAPITQVQIFDVQKNWASVLNCSGDCNTTEIASGLPEGTYYVKVNFYTANWQPLCGLEDYYEVGSGSGISLQGEINDHLLFKAIKDGRIVNLNWVTNTSHKTRDFKVERSSNNIDFEEVGQLVSQGETKQDLYYQIRDENPSFGINYYRIKQIFKYNDFQYSTVREVLFEQELTQISLYPNPASNEIFIDLKPYKGQAAKLFIYNGVGQLMQTNFFEEIPNQAIAINLSDYKAGVYCVTVGVENRKVETLKFVVGE